MIECVLPAMLQDSEAKPEETDELMTRQFKAIEAGLADSCPAVRGAVVGGLCGLLNTFWELIPAPVIAGNLKRLTSQIFPSCSVALPHILSLKATQGSGHCFSGRS